jgi:hypothetical protein
VLTKISDAIFQDEFDAMTEKELFEAAIPLRDSMKRSDKKFVTELAQFYLEKAFLSQNQRNILKSIVRRYE